MFITQRYFCKQLSNDYRAAVNPSKDVFTLTAEKMRTKAVNARRDDLFS
jgi:hypothetical protein